MGIFDRFTGVKVSNLRQTDIESALNDISISSKYDVEESMYISGLLAARQGVAPAIKGLGGISVSTLPDPTPVVVQIPENQIWEVVGVNATNDDSVNAVDVTVTLNDGSNTLNIITTNVAASATVMLDLGKLIPPLILSEDLEIQFSQAGDASSVTTRMAYQVRSV